MTFHRGSAIRPRRGCAVPFSSFAIGHFKAKTVSLVHPENWHSSGIDNLEPDAWRALRQPGCACVVAGPGAGKTEFLAQRAVYLLESGICPPSRRVLAI
jgi:hypothetical protein